MGILRNGSFMDGKTTGRSGYSGNGISVKCPKCGARIVITSMGKEAVRCNRCYYPMICKGDLLSIMEACRNPGDPSQVECAANILRSMTDYYPEAGSALGTLVMSRPLPLDSNECWDKLSSAYAAGSKDAREGLILMCETHSEAYMQCICRNCGASKFIRKKQGGTSPCVFCQSEEGDR